MSEPAPQPPTHRYRITFSKQGVARFTGHLDVQRALERAFRRGRVALVCTGGFHPRPKMQFAAALPLGLASRCELVDVWLAEPVAPADLCAQLAAVAPPGLEILSVNEVVDARESLPSRLNAVAYEVRIEPPLTDVAARVDALLDAGPLPRIRRGKVYDLRPLLQELSVDDAGILRMRLRAGDRGTGRPEEVLDALGLSIPALRVERVGLLLATGGVR